MFDVEGILVPVFTPMKDTGSLDLVAVPKYVEYLNKNDINGIVVGGTTGEAMSLSLSERKLLLEAWVNAAKPSGFKIITQIGGAPLPDVLDLAKHAEKLKVDAIMTLPELYYKPKTVDQLESYLAAVSDAAPTRPLLYYHFPMMTGVEVDMRHLFFAASAKIPNFKGAKADLAVAEQVSDLLAKDQRIFIANHHIAAATLMGFDSSIATVSNIFPRIVQNIVDAVKHGDVAKASKLQKQLNHLVDEITAQGDFVPSMKAAMEIMRSVPMGSTRQPLTPVTQSQYQAIYNIFRDYAQQLND